MNPEFAEAIVAEYRQMILAAESLGFLSRTDPGSIEKALGSVEFQREMGMEAEDVERMRHARTYLEEVVPLLPSKPTPEDLFRKWVREKRENRRWFRMGPAKVFLRLGHRILRDRMTPTLEVASVEVPSKRQGKGVFGKVLLLLEREAVASGRVVFVENVINDSLLESLEKKGYGRVPDTEPPCLFKEDNPLDRPDPLTEVIVWQEGDLILSRDLQGEGAALASLWGWTGKRWELLDNSYLEEGDEEALRQDPSGFAERRVRARLPSLREEIQTLSRREDVLAWYLESR